MKIQEHCRYCGKIAVELTRKKVAGSRYSKLSCGHTIVTQLVTHDYRGMENKVGHKLFPYQVESAEFIDEAAGRACIFHEQGLGKTVISLAWLAANRDTATPCIIFAKSGLVWQWFIQVWNWVGTPAQVINSSRERVEKKFKVVIISYDTASRIPDLAEQTEHIKTVILDECQQIKNSDAKRTKAVQSVVNQVRVQTRTYTPDLPRRAKIKVIATDLMKWYGIADRFQLSFEVIGKRNGQRILGLTECKAGKEGSIEGKITLDKSHAEMDSESEVVETILHEIAHAITPGAGHKPIWSECAKSIGSNGEEFAWCTGSSEVKDNFQRNINVISLSGTPFKNRLSEYFPVLNLTAPTVFPSYSHFMNNVVAPADRYNWSTGTTIKAGTLQDPDWFEKVTKDFIIRYERAEVMPDLPNIFRSYEYHELGDKAQEMFNAELKEFADEMDRSPQGGMHLLAYISRMYHITGVAKIKAIVDHVEEYLDNNPGGKICIFTEHILVQNALLTQLDLLCSSRKINSPIKYTSDLSPNLKAQYQINSVNDIKDGGGWFTNDPKDQVAVCATKVAGEGLNLQQCHYAIMAERQWNPQNEEQAEGRFPRPGSTASGIMVVYMVATGTIDEWFAEIVERKRSLFKQTMGDSGAGEWDESSIIKELMSAAYDQARKLWRPSV